MSWSERQQTVARESACSGIGLHTGEPVTLTLKPAPADAGISFVRTDLRGSRPLTAADVDPNPSPGRTALRNGRAAVQTIEHLMAALVGSGIDNAVVELDGPEVPGLDGSARGFMELIHAAGTRTIDVPAVELVVESPLSVHMGDATLVALPYGDGYRITYTLHYDDNRLAQGHGSFDLTPSVFREELAPARTFCMKSEVEALRALGLGRGASAENTLVIDGDHVEGNTLRFPDEPLRHKVLDIVGDLALLGAPLRGHLIGVRSGHELNRQMVRKLATATRRIRRSARRDVDPVLDVSAVEKLLPHRYPFLFVDRILSLEPGKRIVAVKNVTRNEPYFRGHFPGRPVMPGVLIAEALLQTAALLLEPADPAEDRLSTLAQIDKFRLRRPVVPSDRLILEVELLHRRARIAKVRGVARVDGQVVAEGTFTCVEMVIRSEES